MKPRCKPQGHGSLQEPRYLNKQCNTGQHWGQSIINVLMDEWYVCNGWGEGELDVIKVPWAEMITTMQVRLGKGLCTVLLSSA